jgi:capsular polysaccharide synthesis protein/polysaccharide pyruvyl transferase
MNKTIWTCWFQGRGVAPLLVQKCLRSWERKNPGWEFRCLDATSVERYVPVRQYIDLDRQVMTAAGLSNIVRILLLREFGGVWADATLFCNRPLDEWLPSVMEEGFFAFAAPGPDRPLSTWFLSAESNNDLISTWWQCTIDYWLNRSHSDDYFWCHHRFRDMCEADPSAAEAWSRVPKVSADGPHALQSGGHIYRPASEALADIDWTTPVFKLTHRLSEGLKAGSLLEYLLERDGDEQEQNERSPRVTLSGEAPRSFAALKVSTENLGDHIQIISGLRLLSRLGVEPTRSIDRDNEISSAPGLDKEKGPVGILLNGWFKTNRGEWPPHPKLAPLMIGFHARPVQCPALLSDASLDFFRQYQPIGCRDIYTENLLRSKSVEAFTSNCLSLTLPRRIDNSATQAEVFVASRDERIKNYLPHSIGSYTFISHYSGSNDFAANMTQAEELLETYRTRAKLIITTLLHCAMPAIAMGIPVVVFYPISDDGTRASDRERFSSLEGLVRVHRFEEMESVNWHPEPIDVSEIKLRILDRFYEMAARWQIAPLSPLGPIAPPNVLQPP